MSQEETPKKKRPTAKFKVVGTLDSAGGQKTGVVIIDRQSLIMYVRPFRSHRMYMAPLHQVATYVCMTNINNELREKKALKRKGRRR